MTAPRLSYEESCRFLRQAGCLGDVPDDALPPLPERMPRHDDVEPLGVSFFRTLLADVKLENLTLPRTFFGRSEVRDVSFRNTDLAESNLCWNDFVRVDFRDARLALADLRTSVFTDVDFAGADLRRCDFRGSTIKRCDFTGASLEGAILTRSERTRDFSEAA